MFKDLFHIFNRNLKNELPKGLGVAELPYNIYQGKQPIKSSEFKNIVNKVFLPKVHALGFKGKDFYFYRENEIYTEAVFFWTYKTGGAIQVNLLVKFNNIQYPTEKERSKPNNIRPDKAEFQRRLSPNREKNKNGQEVWFWIFKESSEGNVKIAEDIWRVFSIRGIEYFEKFKYHQQYVGQVTTANYLDFPDFLIQRVFGKYEAGIIYFLFDYWRQMGDIERTNESAKLGISNLNSEHDEPYLTAFKNYLQAIR